jgi:lysozyme
MQMSEEGRLALRRREGVVLKNYDDMGPGVGNCTFGVGALLHRGPCSELELAATVTEAQVEAAYSARVADAERAVARNLTATLTQAQFDALVSLTFNRGPRGAYHAYELINAGDLQGAADWIATLVEVRVRKDGREVSVEAPGLVRRRAEESAPFRRPR